ncbi:hypothetical protein BGW39_006679 [Mortierella sp. 14UC]|nr:hypothetical protein BGW39_006679 [Mortierella sp. 14UC]
MKTFGSFTTVLAVMVALTIALVAIPAEAATRHECMGKCGNEYLACINSALSDRE